MAEIVGAIIGAVATLAAVILAFYLANRLTLNDSMDSKSKWREHLYDIASKDKIELADIYRIRASLRYYPRSYRETNKWSFSWMSSLISNLCDKYLVDVYRNSRNRKRAQTNSAVLPENDEIVRIICRYLLKVHWEARQRMVMFRRRDLMNVDDDIPQGEAKQTVKLILEQVNKMSSRKRKKNLTKIISLLEKSLKEEKDYTKKDKDFKTIISTSVSLSFVILILSVAYKLLTLCIASTEDGIQVSSAPSGVLGFWVIFLILESIIIAAPIILKWFCKK
ncbi:hypothetical protein [Ligilactobacillus agilis]|uniref:hypothetical protein n=1 Tax=Ligilactobacillus agilis TaxID=1601 RepID=UPI00320B1ADD